MTIEDIRKNAPDGATEYMVFNKRSIIYFSKSHGDTMFYHKPHDAWYLYNGSFGYEDIKPLY